MAKMLITSVFTAAGSYFGPIGGMIGGMVGSVVGTLLFPEKPMQVGPRITDLTVISTAYGEPIRDGWGTMAYPGHLVDGSSLLERKHHNKPQGKGFMNGPGTFNFVYDVHAAWLFRRRQAGGFLRVWLDTKLVRNTDATATLAEKIASHYGWKGGSFTFYMGTEDQLPDPTLESIHGIGNVPAYRGMVYLVASNLQLADFANRVPTISGEIYDTGEAGIVEFDRQLEFLPPPPETVDPSGFGGTWTHVNNHGEIVFWHQGAGNGSIYSDPLNRVYRLTPNGVFNEYKLPFSQFGGPTPLSLAHGKMDVEGYTLSDSFSWYVFDYSFGISHQFIKPPTGFTDIYLYSNQSFYKFDTTTKSIAMYKDLSVYPSLISLPLPLALDDWDATLDFIYAIAHTGAGIANPHEIYRIDKITGNVVDTFIPEIPDFSGPLQLAVGGISVINDANLYFSTIVANEGPVTFYLYNTITRSTTLLGSAATSNEVVPDYGLRFIYSNGVFYWGQDAYAGSGLHAVHRFVLNGAGDNTLLSTVVRDCCRYAGIPDARIDVSELTDIVWGYQRDAQTSPADMIRALMNPYLFDACESDGKIKWKKRGRALSFSIPRGDLAAHESGQQMPEKAPARQIQERQLPVTLRVKYIQKNHDYEKGMQYEERLQSDFRNIVELDCAISMPDDQARQIAGRLMPIAWAERNSREIVLSRKYVKLEISDAFEVTI